VSRPPLSPGDVAAADQLMAVMGPELDTLTEAVRTGDEEHGEAQNLANFIAWLSSRYDSSHLAALLVTAARRIRGES
jgi:hypothetical protein